MLTMLKHVFPKASISKLAILSHEKIEQVFCIFAIIATWLPSAFNLEISSALESVEYQNPSFGEVNWGTEWLSYGPQILFKSKF